MYFVKHLTTKLLYLDIDGVLLGKAKHDDIEVILAKHAMEFLEYCLQHYKCYWLTTHCKEGDRTAVVNLLKNYADEYAMRLIKLINPTSWETLKTEAIDFSSDFYWLDDQLLCSEIELLKKNNVFDRWVQVDTRRNPDDLKRVISVLG